MALFDCYAMSEQAGLPHNDDCVLIEPGYGVFAVADGMGGRPGGAQASRVVLRAFMDYLRRVNPAAISTPVALCNAVAVANSAVRAIVEADPKMRGMGTTLTAAIVTDEGGRIVHVGDSRTYLFAKGRVEQLTQDHTLVSEMLEHEMLPDEPGGASSLENVLSRAVGTRSSVEPEIVDFRLGQYDWLLLATDGFHKVLGSEEMAELIVFSAGENAQHLCRTLVNTAINADPQDNVTLAVIRRLVRED